MTRTMLVAPLLLATLSIGCAADDVTAIDDDAPAEAGKADSFSKKHDKECKAVAAHLVETYVLRNWDWGGVIKSTVIARDHGAMTLDIVALDGGFDEGIFRVEMSSGCKSMSIEQLMFFTPEGEDPIPPPPIDLEKCQEQADLATKAFVLADWDFDFVQSHQILDVTPTTILMELVVIDGGFDEGTFEVRLDRLCIARRVEQTGSFTP